MEFFLCKPKGGGNAGREDASIARTMVSQGSRSCFNFCNMERAVLEKDKI